jgi:hypothetical protein
MIITKIYYQDEDFKICRTDDGVIAVYNFKDEVPSFWLEYQMRIMTWHVLDGKAEFKDPDVRDGYWYIPICLSKQRVRSPIYRFGKG